jgi:four helix bundle protein
MERGRGADIRQRTFEFACAVTDLHRLVWKNEPALRRTSQQACSAATSVGANLEEAEAGQSRADFASKCNIALKEAREARYWLRILHRTLQLEKIEKLIQESTELVAILTSIVKKAREEQK